MYEHEFVDHIFETFETRVDKEEFIDKIIGSKTSPSKLASIFNPSKIRELLYEHVDFAELESNISVAS